jgi:hypothetical protein
MPDRSGWLEFNRPAFRLQFLHPPVTPRGEPVEITEEQHGGAYRVHLTAREGGELYLEFFRFPDLQPPDEYARHRSYLVGRFGPEAVSELTETSLRGWPAFTPPSSAERRHHRDGEHPGVAAQESGPRASVKR